MQAQQKIPNNQQQQIEIDQNDQEVQKQQDDSKSNLSFKNSQNDKWE